MYNKIAHKIDDAGDYDGMICHVISHTTLSPPFHLSDGSFGPVLLRLAWHASGTFDKETKTGGRYCNDLTMSTHTPRLICESSNYATMRFEPEALHGANNGLNIARGLMEEIKKEFDWISYGDLWTLAGVAAIQVNNRVFFLEG